jgi:hypothetical protein
LRGLNFQKSTNTLVTSGGNTANLLHGGEGISVLHKGFCKGRPPILWHPLKKMGPPKKNFYLTHYCNLNTILSKIMTARLIREKNVFFFFFSPHAIG